MTPTLDAAWLDAMLEAERHDEALEQLNAALEAQPDNARLYALRGNFWASAWHHRDAAEDWETALSLDPSLHEVQLQLALLEITRPYRLADGGDDDEFADDDGVPDDDVWSEEDEEESEAQLKRMLQEALEAGAGGTALPSWGDTAPDGEIWPGDDEDDHDFFEFRSEDSLRVQGLTRLQQLADDGLLSEAQLLQAVTALSETAWLPWHALDLVQRGLAATPASPALQRARVALWISLATDLVDAGEDVPVGYSADLTGNLYHPVSAATALQYGDSLLAEAWDADLYESRAQLHRLLGNHAAAAEDFNHAARLVESLAGSADSEAGDAARSRLQQLQSEIAVCEGGDSALIAARQQHMQDTLAKLADMQQSLGVPADEPQHGNDTVLLDEARDAALDYIDTIGLDPLQDADYVAEVLAQIPGIADAILQTLENEPYDFRGLTERELFERVGDADAQLYVAERAAFVRQGFATIGWMELQSLSRRLGKPAILDLLLSPDQTTAGLCFVLGGVPTREVHTVFADGGSLSHATLRGRSAGWTPAPFRQAHLPPETPLELLLRLHGSAVSLHIAESGEQPVPLHPSRLPEQFEQLRQRRHEARLAQGFHDAEVRGYSGEHYRAGGQSLREALAAHLARLRPRTH